MNLTLLLTAVPAVLALPVQDGADEPRIPAILDFERDRGLTLAVVDGRKVRLGDLATHLQRYDPAVVARWSDPDGSRDLNSRALPQLLWQYADVLCLRAECEQRRIALAGLDERIERKLAASFRDYLARLQAGRARGTETLTKSGVAFYRRRHRREQGLEAEINALLDLLLPPRYTRTQLREWHTQHGDIFGGQVKMAHILFQLRDPATGRLKPAAERRRLTALARDVCGRLRKDPGLFAELARKYSDDRVTRNRGGVFEAWTRRINPRLPAPLVRAAWELPDGAVSEPVVSYYGIHVVRRLKQVVNSYILFYGKTIDRITNMRSKLDQEALLHEVRKRHDVRLFL